jgi:hypothetical protein
MLAMIAGPHSPRRKPQVNAMDQVFGTYRLAQQAPSRGLLARAGLSARRLAGSSIFLTRRGRPAPPLLRLLCFIRGLVGPVREAVDTARRR